MFQRILVPLDGSPGAERAIPVAARIARNAGGSLVFLQIVPPLPVLGEQADEARGVISDVKREERALTGAAGYLAEAIAAHARDLTGIPTEMDVAFGLTSPTLTSTARLEQVDLVVMCSHHKTGVGQWGIESIAQQTMRHSPVPLLILHERGEMLSADAVRPLRVLVPLDGSLLAETALEPALQAMSQLHRSRQDELYLLRIVEERCPRNGEDRPQAERYLQAVCERINKGKSASCRFSLVSQVRVGTDIAKTLLEEAKQGDFVSLIAMATHGHEGIPRLLLGSVAERVLDATTCPLLVVCPRIPAARTTGHGQATGKF
ncbi:MAG TPA: universal stress protein [Ktedonobacteraceae bacterium]